MSESKVVIPDEAVEAAVKANLERSEGYLWGNTTEDSRAKWREYVRPMLEAAAPYMLAEAWEDGGRAATGTYDTGYPIRNPYRKDEAAT